MLVRLALLLLLGGAAALPVRKDDETALTTNLASASTTLLAATTQMCGPTAGLPGNYWYARNGGNPSGTTIVHVRLQYQSVTGEWGPPGPVTSKAFWHPSYHGPMFQGPNYYTGVNRNSGAGGVVWNPAAFKAFRYWRVTSATSTWGCIRVYGGGGGSDSYNEIVESIASACPSIVEIKPECNSPPPPPPSPPPPVKCASCELVPCGQCQEGCPPKWCGAGYAAGASANWCANGNYRAFPVSCSTTPIGWPVSAPSPKAPPPSPPNAGTKESSTKKATYSSGTSIRTPTLSRRQ